MTKKDLERELESLRRENQVYRDWLFKDPWGQKPWNLRLILSGEESDLLAHILGMDSYVRKKDLDVEGFFYYTRSFVEGEIYMNKDTQKRILSKLKKMGIIEIKMKGIPTMRYIRIDLRVLCDLVRRAQDALK